MRLVPILGIAAAIPSLARGADPEPGISVAGSHRGIRATSAGRSFRATFDRIAEIRLPVRSYDREPFFLRATVHGMGPGGRLLAARAIRLVDRYDFAPAVFRFAPDAVPLRRGAEYSVHIERCGGGVFEVRGAAGAKEPGEIAIEISPNATPEVVERPWASEGDPSPGTGSIAGSTGGNERDCVLFARGGEEIRMRHTAPDGLYRFDGVPPGEYMCLSSGRVAARVRVRAGETTTLDWGPFEAYDPGAETWSPPCIAFGQTFVATGRSLLGISFWIPGRPVRLEAILRRDGPEGPVAGRHAWPDPVSWVVSQSFAPDAIPLEPGRTYHLALRSTDGARWAMGAVDVGEGYAFGRADYDGEVQPGSDLAMGLREDGAGGLRTIAEVSGGLGFVREGPASGLTRVAAQSFVATTRNIIAAYANAGWGSSPERVARFVFSIEEDRPGGRRIGPEVRTRMVSDWGATAVWFPDDVPVEPGRTYVLAMRREDGEPFYAYLASDAYPKGCAHRDGAALPGFDLTFSIRGEDVPAGPPHPFDVRVEDVAAHSATIVFETGSPARAAAEIRSDGRSRRIESDRIGTIHRIEVSGLSPLSPYIFVPIATSPRDGAVGIRAARDAFLTAAGKDEGPRFLDPILPPQDPPPAGRAIALGNPGFEDGLASWRRRGEWGGVTRGGSGFSPARGRAMFGWSCEPDPASGDEIPRKLEPPRRTWIAQAVEVAPGSPHVLSAWILTGERGGGWQRNDRVRLFAGAARILEDGVDPDDLPETRSTQWFTTRGRWLRVHLRFTPRSRRIAIGAELFQWYQLEANHLYVDALDLIDTGS